MFFVFGKISSRAMAVLGTNYLVSKGMDEECVY